jgi:hypothetical protein
VEAAIGGEGLERMTEMLLFGAGASIGAGLPTTQQLTQRIVDWFIAHEKPDVSGALRFVVAGVEMAAAARGRPSVDIESVMIALRALAGRKDLELSAFVGSWHPTLLDLERVDAKIFERTADRVEERLQKVLLISDRSKTAYLGPLRSILARQDSLWIATLNYDNVVEQFCGSEIPHSEALHGSYSSRVGYVFDWKDKGINLIPLHGYLLWMRHNNPPPELRPPRPSVANPPGTNQIRLPFVLRHGQPYDSGNILWGQPGIQFGWDNKLTAHGPYLKLLEQFRTTLRGATRLTIVGYSFRDWHVNEPIAQFLNESVETRVCVVDPKPPMDHEFMQELDKFGPRVQIIAKEAQVALAELFQS